MPEIPPPPNSFKHKDDEGYFTIPWQQWYLKLHAAAAALVNLATGVTGRLPYSHFTQASAASKLLGRGSAAGAGDWQEISLGSNLSMIGTTLAATASTPGGASGDVQYNNAGAFAGSVLKQPAADVIEQVDGTTTQEARFYNTTSGGGANFERLTTKVANDFFAESAYSFIAQKAGTGTDKGIAFNAPGSISFTIPGANPSIVIYHDPTSSGGISLIPNGSAFVGSIFCDQSGSFMWTQGGFGVPFMVDALSGSATAYMLGTDVSGATFNNQMLTVDTRTGAGERRIYVGNATPGATSLGVQFSFDNPQNSAIANLSTTARKSAVCWVNDALAPVIGNAVVAGGAAFAAVMWNGSQWTVIGV